MDQEKSQKFRVGIDIGGTFTDIIFIGDDGTVYTKKRYQPQATIARESLPVLKKLFKNMA